jgi:hypothetical protein
MVMQDRSSRPHYSPLRDSTKSTTGHSDRFIKLQLVAARDSGDHAALISLAPIVDPIVKYENVRYSKSFDRVALEDLIQAGRCGALEVAASFTGNRRTRNPSNAPSFLTLLSPDHPKRSVGLHQTVQIASGPGRGGVKAEESHERR